MAPRCATCAVVHRKQAPLQKIVLPIAVLAFSGLCILIGVVGTDSLKFWSWVIGAIVALVGIFALAAITVYLSNRWSKSAGTVPVTTVQFPEVQELVKQGWMIDETKTGKSIGKK